MRASRNQREAVGLLACASHDATPVSQNMTGERCAHVSGDQTATKWHAATIPTLRSRHIAECLHTLNRNCSHKSATGIVANHQSDTAAEANISTGCRLSARVPGSHDDSLFSRDFGRFSALSIAAELAQRVHLETLDPPGFAPPDVFRAPVAPTEFVCGFGNASLNCVVESACSDRKTHERRRFVPRSLPQCLHRLRAHDHAVSSATKVSRCRGNLTRVSEISCREFGIGSLPPRDVGTPVGVNGRTNVARSGRKVHRPARVCSLSSATCSVGLPSSANRIVASASARNTACACTPIGMSVSSSGSGAMSLLIACHHRIQIASRALQARGVSSRCGASPYRAGWLHARPGDAAGTASEGIVGRAFLQRGQNSCTNLYRRRTSPQSMPLPKAESHLSRKRDRIPNAGLKIIGSTIAPSRSSAGKRLGSFCTSQPDGRARAAMLSLPASRHSAASRPWNSCASCCAPCMERRSTLPSWTDVSRPGGASCSVRYGSRPQPKSSNEISSEIHEGPLPKGGEGMRVSGSERWCSLTHKAAGLRGRREETPHQPPAPHSRGARKCAPHLFSSGERTDEALAREAILCVGDHVVGVNKVIVPRDRRQAGMGSERSSLTRSSRGRASPIRLVRWQVRMLGQGRAQEPCGPGSNARTPGPREANSRRRIRATARGSRNPRTLINGSGGSLVLSKGSWFWRPHERHDAQCDRLGVGVAA